MAMHTGNKVPQIRIRGFNGEWTEKPIEKILSEMNRSIVLEDNQKYELITVKRRNEGVISRGHLLGRNILVKNYFQLEAGDFVISKRQVVHGATGVVPESLNKAIVSNEYLVATGNDEISSEFLALMSRLPDMKRKYLLSSYGVDIEKLFFDVDDWRARVITIPKIDEQNEISSLFNQLNREIESCQKKHNKLTTLKNTMLQNMFPQNGSAAPRVRFNGFTENWREKELKTVLNVYSGRDYKHLPPGNIPVYGTGGYMLSVGEALSHDQDAIGIGRKGTINKPYILKSPFWTVDTLFYAIPKDGIDLDFTFCIFQTIDWKKKDESTGVPSLTKGAIDDASIFIPSSREQQKIGSYFRHLDTLITLQATQCAKLKQIKSAYLEKMFV